MLATSVYSKRKISLVSYKTFRWTRIYMDDDATVFYGLSNSYEISKNFPQQQMDWNPNSRTFNYFFRKRRKFHDSNISRPAIHFFQIPGTE